MFLLFSPALGFVMVNAAVRMNDAIRLVTVQNATEELIRDCLWNGVFRNASNEKLRIIGGYCKDNNQSLFMK